VTLVSIFANNILPVFLAAGAGYLLGKFLHLNPRPLSQAVFYIFSPCLLFNLLTTSKISNGEILRVLGFAVVVISATGFLALVVGKFFKFERRLLAAVLLTSMFMNAGNFGLPLVNFAFGAEALAYAGLMFVGMNILINSVGVMIASLGTSDLRKSLLNLFKIPAIYGVILGILIISMGWELPKPLGRTVEILSGASIPCMLVLLGLQFHNIQWKGQKSPIALVSSIRLVIAPLLALAISSIFRIQGSALQAGIIETGMPSAVLTIVIATEFDVEPSFVTAVVFVTTLLSPLTLTPLLYYMGA
jgi:predicted permease